MRRRASIEQAPRYVTLINCYVPADRLRRGLVHVGRTYGPTRDVSAATLPIAGNADSWSNMVTCQAQLATAALPLILVSSHRTPQTAGGPGQLGIHALVDWQLKEATVYMVDALSAACSLERT
jgi:hypothetical protein